MNTALAKGSATVECQLVLRDRMKWWRDLCQSLHPQCLNPAFIHKAFLISTQKYCIL
jgi:hypothetical protein